MHNSCQFVQILIKTVNIETVPKHLMYLSLFVWDSRDELDVSISGLLMFILFLRMVAAYVMNLTWSVYIDVSHQNLNFYSYQDCQFWDGWGNYGEGIPSNRKKTPVTLGKWTDNDSLIRICPEWDSELGGVRCCDM